MKIGGLGCWAGLGHDQRGRQLHVLAVEAGLLVAPERLHRQHLLADQLAPLLRHDAVVLHLVDVPAVPDAEDEATVGHGVDRRHLLGQQRSGRAGRRGRCQSPASDSLVTAAAAPSMTNGSWVRRYSSGSSPPPGYGVRRDTGMCVCSGTNSDSKPRSSSARASSTTPIDLSVRKIVTPMSMQPKLRRHGRLAHLAVSRRRRGSDRTTA